MPKFIFAFDKFLALPHPVGLKSVALTLGVKSCIMQKFISFFL